MKSLIAKYIVKPFKSFPYFGRFRFWCLYWAYKVTGWHIRHHEWDFVLKYLPSLEAGQRVRVLDVGCSRNLFCYEVTGRGYELMGVDLEKPKVGKYPGSFWQGDIKELSETYNNFDFVTCISVLEHIEEGEHFCIEKMMSALKYGGRLLLTIPTEQFAIGHPWEGFNGKDIQNLFRDYPIRNWQEAAGQHLLCIEKL